MFLVLNKEKISAYIVSILTVCFLFFIAGNISSKENITPTSTNVQTVKENNNVNVQNSVNNTLSMNNAVN